MSTDNPFSEPFKIKMVEPVYRSSRREREQWLRDSGYNLFRLNSHQVMVDLLTDSGTGAMSNRQWSALMMGDESYAGASSFRKFKETVSGLTGFEYVLPTHQGRAAENVLFSSLIKEGDIIPGNTHFDTTKGHIEYRKATAVDCTIDEAFSPEVEHPFKGNVDLHKLRKVLEKYPAEKIPLVVMTVTCNSAGGQPVSMENIRSVSETLKKHGIPLFIDGARFAENAWFIRQREPGYGNKSIREIVREMFSYSDGMTMSSKKDGLVNMGGFIAFRNQAMYEAATVYNIMFEGFVTYGGMSGRDMEALAVGLQEAVEESYLEYRTRQVSFLGKQLQEAGIPVVVPFGGHAVFIDALGFFPWIPREEFPAQTLATELYLEGGIRSAEIGALMADRDPETRENRYPDLEMVRLAIPRRVYTDNHLAYTADSVIRVWKRRKEIRKGLRIIHEAPILRHFTVQLERIKDK